MNILDAYLDAGLSNLLTLADQIGRHKVGTDRTGERERERRYGLYKIVKKLAKIILMVANFSGCAGCGLEDAARHLECRVRCRS